MNAFLRTKLCLCCLLIGCLSLLCSCREKKVTPSPVPEAAALSPVPTARIELSPEQLASVLRVRVAFGGLPPSDTAAVLLHREEIPDQSLVSGNCRFVLAPLKGWQESQLRNEKAVLIVYRNKANRAGTMTLFAYPARLVQFDAASGFGVLAYIDEFAYADDAGFRLERGDTTHSDMQVLRTFRNAADSLPELNRRNGDQKPFLIDAGTFWGVSGAKSGVNLPPLDSGFTADPLQIAVTGKGRFAGFVDATGPSPVFNSSDRFNVAIGIRPLQVSDVSFFTHLEGRYQIDLTVDGEPGEARPVRMILLTRELSRARLQDLPKPDAAGHFAPISQTAANLSRLSKTWQVTLTKPQVDREAYFLMQIGWPMVWAGYDIKEPWQSQIPMFYGQPFVVKMTIDEKGFQPTVLELPPAAEGVPAPDTTQVGGRKAPEKFALEAAAKDVHLMSGGREALFELEGAPYWKRFSFEKKQWLPLPGDLSNVSITGNLNTLFVLDRTTRQVQKFKLPGLEAENSIKLPSADYRAILAGSNSEGGPVHVMMRDEALALGVQSLRRRDAPRLPEKHPSAGGTQPNDFKYSITGDGLSVRRLNRETDYGFTHYNSDSRGLEPGYHGIQGHFGGIPGVSGGFDVMSGLRSRDTPDGQIINLASPSPPWTYAPAALAQNSPVVFRVLRPDAQGANSTRARLGCFAIGAGLPFAETDVPELSETATHDLWKMQRWVFFDPYSRRIATLSTDRKMWFVRDLEIAETRDQPVLLNWPDTIVTAGEKFHFQPLLAGGRKFTAELHGKPGVAVVDEIAGTVEFPVEARDIASVQLLDLKVPGKDGKEISYPIAARVFGAASPLIAAPGGGSEISQWAVEPALATLAGVTSPTPRDAQPLTTTLIQLKDPATGVVGPVAGCVALIAANRVDFLSLEKRSIVGSLAVPPDSCFYAGAGALLEYDQGKRSLSRISVPDGTRKASIDLPPKTRLRAIGVGTDPSSPITVFVESSELTGALRFSDVTITESRVYTNCVVLDGFTLKAGNRTQPKTLGQLLGKSRPNNIGGYIGQAGALREKPVTLPTSRNGSMVTLPDHFLALSPSYAVMYPFANNTESDLGARADRMPSGSLTGLMAFSAFGQAYKAGMKVGIADNYNSLGSSPCGRYQFRRGDANEEWIDIRLAENGEPLLRVMRLAFMHDLQRSRFAVLGDEGPLGILSESGQTLELVDLGVPTIMKLMAPERFHVVSQPIPYVMEGRAMSYQVQVNNPDAVESFHLQNAVPGASISPQGLLTYTAPTSITDATKVIISIEIAGKNGQRFLHEFPIYTLPWPKPTDKPLL